MTRWGLARAIAAWPALALAWALGGAAQAAPPAATAVTAAPLRIATGEFPPYATESRPDLGIAPSIVRRAFALSGHAVRFEFLPWSRAQRETQEGHFDASSHWGASPERRAKFLLSDSVLEERWVLLHRTRQPLVWKEVADLRGLRVGMTQDYTYTPQLWQAANEGTVIRVAVVNDLAGLRMLLAGRFDVLPLERSVACSLLVQHFSAEQAAQLTHSPLPLNDRFTTHLILPRDAAGRSQKLLEAFNRGLAALRASPEYGRLLRAVDCPAHWPAM